MDSYTSTTREWLDARFRRRSGAEPYTPHQPVYGFLAARDAGVLRDYVRIYRVLRALSHLTFETLLDVGGAEGMVAALARRLFAAQVQMTDLSREACARAHEMFGVGATAADVHALPFADESFDVVLCTETLEHVYDPRVAMNELMRVARRAVVISVPHEPVSLVDQNRRCGEPHAHIHAFGLRSFDEWKPMGGQVRTTPMMSGAFRVPLALMEARTPSARATRRAGKVVSDLYGIARPILRRLNARPVVTAAMVLDEFVCRVLPSHDGVLAVLLKDSQVHRDEPRVRIRPRDILTFAAEQGR